MIEPAVQAPTLPFIESTRAGIEQETILGRIDLNTSGAQASELGNFIAQDLNDVREKAIQRRIDISRNRRRPEVSPQAWARKRDLGNSFGSVFQINEFVNGKVTLTDKPAGCAKLARTRTLEFLAKNI